MLKLNLAVWSRLIVMSALAVPVRAQQSALTPKPPVFGAETSLIHVDAVVIDKAGKLVTNLKASDFRIESKGKTYTAAVATYVRLVDDETTGSARDGKLRAQDVRRVIAFLSARPVIELPEGSNIPGKMTARPRVDRMYRTFVNEYAKPQDLVAFVNADSAKPLMNQFTSDPRVMTMAIDLLHKEWDNPQASPIFRLPHDEGAPIARYCVEVFRLARKLVAQLKELPGRKILFVVSGVLGIDTGASPVYAEAGEEARNLTDDANRAGVTIYGVNPGGTDSGFSDALGFLAEQTGGSTIENTELLAPNLGKVMQQNRGYYLLGYDAGEVPDKLPRQVKVRVNRPDIKVMARPQVYQDSALMADAPPGSVERGLASFLNSPLAAGSIRIRLTPFVAWAAAGAGELQAVVDIDPKSLANPQSDAGVDLEVITRVVDQAGIVLKANRVAMKAGARERGLQGIRFALQTPLARPGIYQADVAIEDKQGGQFGNATAVVTLPDLNANKNALLASALALRPADRPAGLPNDVFAQNSKVSVDATVAHARRVGKTRKANLSIRIRVRKGATVVIELEPQTLSDELPELIRVTGALDLKALSADVYVAELEITDLLSDSKTNKVTLTREFTIVEGAPAFLERPVR
ncbi:MAG: VWA domain-containing protein [Vicinamibacteria bacterium]